MSNLQWFLKKKIENIFSGLCCIFNGLNSKFTMKDDFKLAFFLQFIFLVSIQKNFFLLLLSDLMELNTSNSVKIEESFWSPESGYPPNVLKRKGHVSPRPAAG